MRDESRETQRRDIYDNVPPWLLARADEQGLHLVDERRCSVEERNPFSWLMQH
jgi:hypothetical protein